MKFRRIAANAAEAAGTFRQHPSTHDLSKLASLNSEVQTKTHARLVLRHHGLSGAAVVVEALMLRIKEILAARRTAAARRIEKKLGRVPAFASRQRGRDAILLPKGTPSQRLELLRKREIQATAKSCLRFGAAGGSSFKVVLTRDPRLVDYQVEMAVNRDTYRGRYKGWSAKEDHHVIRVPEDWRLRVQRRGLAVAGGMLTLDLHPLVSHGETELFQAVWVAQSRGYEVTVHRGVIARLGAEVYHGKDVQQALRGVTRKVQHAQVPRRQPVGAYELSVEDFIRRYARYSAVEVAADDAREVGACEYGIESWCHAVGIDLALDRVPLRRVLAGFQAQPQVEVRRTVLQAVRRHRVKSRASHAA